MNKVGLITFHHSHNLGGNLQAYATMRVIEELGYPCEIIDYRIKEGMDTTYIATQSFKSRLPYFVRRLVFFSKFRKRNKGFTDFRSKFLKIGTTVYYYGYELIENPPKYSCYVCGSDQIWNPLFYNKSDSFFLDFVKDKPKISYASSLGTDAIPDNQTMRYKRLLSDFLAISVREEQGVKALRYILGDDVNIYHAIDPTLLISSEQWGSLAGKRTIKQKYILLYCFRSHKDIIQEATRMARNIGAKVISIYPVEGDIIHGFHLKYDCTPISFINYIKYAEFIFTDSYHGLVFTLNFNKPFKFKLKSTKNNDNARIISLLEKSKFNNPQIINDVIDGSSVSYEDINARIFDWRQESMDFLSKALGSAIKHD